MFNEHGELKLGKLVGIILAAILLVVVALTSFTIISTGYTGVVSTFGKVENYTLEPGFHLKAPWQSITKMDNRVQKKSAELSCFSSDIQEVAMNFTINFKISQKDAMTIYSTIGKDYYETVVLPNVTDAVKAETAKFTAEELITNRAKLVMNIENALAQRLKNYNIEVVSIAVENIDFTDAFTEAVEAKQVAQQNKLKAETEAETKVIQATAEADVKRISTDATAYENEKLSQSLTSAILQKMYYEKWNGVLPQVVSDGSTVLIPKQ